MLRMYLVKYSWNEVFHKQSFPLSEFTFPIFLITTWLVMLICWWENIVCYYWHEVGRENIVLENGEMQIYCYIRKMPILDERVFLASKLTPSICKVSILGYFKKFLLILFECAPTLFWLKLNMSLIYKIYRKTAFNCVFFFIEICDFTIRNIVLA